MATEAPPSSSASRKARPPPGPRRRRSASRAPELALEHHRARLHERAAAVLAELTVRDVEAISRVRAEVAHVAAAHAAACARSRIWSKVVVVVPRSYKFSSGAREAGVALGAEALARRVREVAHGSGSDPALSSIWEARRRAIVRGAGAVLRDQDLDAPARVVLAGHGHQRLGEEVGAVARDRHDGDGGPACGVGRRAACPVVVRARRQGRRRRELAPAVVLRRGAAAAFWGE